VVLLPFCWAIANWENMKNDLEEITCSFI
jgi:hypothetical protein